MRKTHQQRRIERESEPLKRWPRKVKREAKIGYGALLTAIANDRAAARGLAPMSKAAARRGLRAFYRRTHERMTIRDNVRGTSVTFHFERGGG